MNWRSHDLRLRRLEAEAIHIIREAVAEFRNPVLLYSIGNIANAVMCGLIDSPFEDLTMYSEVLQDSTFDLIDAGKLSFASGSSITLSERRNSDVFGNALQGGAVIKF